MASNVVLSSFPMWVAPLVRVSKLAPVASIVRSRPWPSLSQPSAACHRFDAFLMPDGDPAQHLPVEERAERADPGVAAQRGEGLADAHHVGLGDADVERAALVDGGDTGFEAAGRREIGIDGHDTRISGEHLHRERDDVAGRVFLRGIETRQERRVVLNAFVSRRNPCRDHGADHLRTQRATPASFAAGRDASGRRCRRARPAGGRHPDGRQVRR